MSREPWAQSPTWFPGTPQETRAARTAERDARANQPQRFRALSSYQDWQPVPSSHPFPQSSHSAGNESMDNVYDPPSFNDVPMTYDGDTPSQGSSSRRRSLSPRSRSRRVRTPSPRSRSYHRRKHDDWDRHPGWSQLPPLRTQPPLESLNVRRSPPPASAADQVPARQPGDNENYMPPGMKVWRGLNGDIWSSPSPGVTGWPSRVPPTGPLRFDAPSKGDNSEEAEGLVNQYESNLGQPSWWSPSQPHMAFYPRYPLGKESEDNVLKSLAHVASEDDAIKQQADGTWAPRLSQAWVNLGIMLGMIYSVLFLAYASDSRFPAREWRPLTPGWWNMKTWNSDRNVMSQVARFQRMHLVTFSASVSYLCAIARFKTGEPDAWYRSLQNFGLNNSVRRWCDRLRHTWIPLTQDIKRAGTFFDAQDIVWPDLFQLHLDAGISFFIYWGREVEKIPLIQKGIIPDHFRPTPAQVRAAPPPPGYSTVPNHLPPNRHGTAAAPASSGEKRRRDGLAAQPSQDGNPPPDLQRFRDHFRRAYAHYLRHKDDPLTKVNAERANRWEVAKKDKGCLWEHTVETGEVHREPEVPVSGERMKELVEDEELTWLIRYDPTSRHWHRLPEGTFAAPQAVIDRGIDMDSRFFKQNANEVMRKRGPVLTKEDWEHLIGLQSFVVDNLRPQQYAPISHELKSIIPTLEHGILGAVDAADLSNVQSLIAARSASPDQAAEDTLMTHPSHVPVPAQGDNLFAQLPIQFGTDKSLPFDDWLHDVACGPDERIRVAGIQSALNRAGFVRRADNELSALIRRPLTFPNPPKLVPVLQYSLATLGAWPGYFGAKADDSQWTAYETELGDRLGMSTSLSNSIADFTARLISAGIDLVRDKMPVNKGHPKAKPRRPQVLQPQSQPAHQPPPFHRPAVRTWMYDPASADEAFSMIAKRNVWQVETVMRTVLGPKDGRAEAKDADVEGWLLTCADGHHGRGVVLYDACVVVQILLDPSFETGDDIIIYCAQSTIRFNEAAVARVAREHVHSADQVSTRRSAALAFRSSHVLGYRPADHVVGGTDFIDYEEARRRLFQNLMIVLAAIKAGGIVARLALEHLAPDVVLQGPHADTLELELGARIRQTLGGESREFTDDKLTPELELFIVGGFYEQVGQSPSNFDHVRTFFPRNKTWRSSLPGPGWDFNKESVYQHYRSMNLNPLRDDKSSFGPCSNNGWSQRLKRWADHRRAFTAIEHHANQFLQVRSAHKYFR